MATVARTDLKQLAQARDFWVPMTVLGALFYAVIPATLLLTIGQIGSVDVVERVSSALEVLPETARTQMRGDSPAGQAGYALAVFLFAPVAVIVPLTISTAVGAATIVGERERGTRPRDAQRHPVPTPRRRPGNLRGPRPSRRGMTRQRV